MLGKGLIDAKSLVSGDYMVSQIQTRNSIFRVARKKAKGLFIKQLNNFDQNNTYVLQKDATCLWLIKNEPAFRALNKYVPEYFGYDTEHQVLITEYLSDAKSLEYVVQSAGELPAHFIDQLAQMMASYQFNLSEKVKSLRSVQFFPKQVPWVLNLMDMPAQTFQQMTNSSNPNPVFSLVANNEGFRKLVGPIKENWKTTSLIHGDIKWMNILVASPNDKPKLKLIDWEIADIGDPLWDIAGIFAAIITTLVLKKQQQNPNAAFAPYQVSSLADLQEAWPTIIRFWNQYLKKRKARQEPAEQALKKTIDYTGVRLIQSAVEQNMMQPQIQPNATMILQASYLVLEKAAEIFNQLTEQKTVKS